MPANDWPQTICASTSVRRVDRALSRLYDDALRPTGLGVNQYSLLSLIDRAPEPATVSALAHAQVMDRTTLTRVLAPLERDGLVRLTPGTDRRTRTVSITPAGRDRVDMARPLWRAAQNQINHALGNDRMEHLLADMADILSRVRTS